MIQAALPLRDRAWKLCYLYCHCWYASNQQHRPIQRAFVTYIQSHPSTLNFLLCDLSLTYNFNYMHISQFILIPFSATLTIYINFTHLSLHSPNHLATCILLCPRYITHYCRTFHDRVTYRSIRSLRFLRPFMHVCVVFFTRFISFFPISIFYLLN